MRVRPDRFSGAVLLLLLVAPGRVSQARAGDEDHGDEGFPAVMLERGIRHDIERSPHDYVAVVVEQAGTQECETKDEPTVCRSLMRVVELLAAQPSSDVKEFFLFSGSGSDTRAKNSNPSALEQKPDESHRAQTKGPKRLLVFAAPMEGRPGTYGASFMAIHADAVAVAQMRSILKSVLEDVANKKKE